MHEGRIELCIDGGIAPFQIVQQNKEGMGSLTVHGRWRSPDNRGTVQLRIAREDDGTAVSTSTGWQRAYKQDSISWEHRFDSVPVGGLYRLEARLLIDPTASEWSPYGNVIHHFGVGDIWVIAGQSNAAGCGRGPVFDPPELGVHILRNDGTWDIAAHPLRLNPGHSPYLRFARDLKTALHYPIGIIQIAVGATSLSAWNPVENPDAHLYRSLIQHVKLVGGHVRGMLWYQGESDSDPALAPTYERRFSDFVRRLRSDLATPDLPVIIAQLNRYAGSASVEDQRGYSIVREAQRQAVNLGHVAVLPTLDLPLSDHFGHNNPDSNLILGRRKARAALALAYGRAITWQAPDVREAFLSNGRKTIELSFDNVVGHLAFVGPGEGDFVVEDTEGFIPVQAVSCSACDRVQLELERPTVGQTLVHGAFGTNPPSHIRDVEENMPILGFYGLVATPGAEDS